MLKPSISSVVVEPGRPEGPLIISNVQADSVHLSWKTPSEDGGGTILGFLIEAKDVLHVDIHKTYIWSEGPNTEYEVKGLQTSHIYQFRVYAQNEAGRGEALLNKNVIRIKAASKKPPSPSKPSVEVQDDDSVLLQWTVPPLATDVNYIIERYEPKSELWHQCNHGVVVRQSYLVTGLCAGKEYKFRITCENAHGVSTPSAESDPVIIKDDEDEPPKVIIPLQDCFVKVDDAASFSCQYSGSQPISVNWSKDGIRVRDGYKAFVKTETTRSTLTLEDIESDDDESSVQCDLRNAEGKASSHAKIKLLSPPKISCPSSYKDGLTYDAGDSLRLKISFTGKPNPKVCWFFNNEQPSLDNRTKVLLEEEFIEVRICELKHTDSGSFKFVAENDTGRDTLDVHVIITGPPSPPDFLSLEMISEDKALMVWSSPLYDGGSSIFNYTVEIQSHENGDWERFATVHEASMPITDMTLLNKASFRIRAVNVYGASEPSTELQYKNIHEDLKLEEDSQHSLDYSKNYDSENYILHRITDADNGCTKTITDLTTTLSEEDVGNANLVDIPSDVHLSEDSHLLDQSKIQEFNNYALQSNIKPIVDLKANDSEEYKNNTNIVDVINDRCMDYIASTENQDTLVKETVITQDNLSKTGLEMGKKSNSQVCYKENEKNEDVNIDLHQTLSVSNQQDLDTEINLRHPITKNANEIIPIAELKELDVASPLKIIYVATQTLISLPMLNYACTNIRDFDEITYFAAEVTPVEEYLVQSIDHILCYIVCCFNIVLESLPTDDFSLTQYGPMQEQCSALHIEDIYLQNYVPFCCDYVSKLYSLGGTRENAHYVEHITDAIMVSEEISIEEINSKHTSIKLVESITPYCEAILITLQPWILRSFQPFMSDTIFKHNLTVSNEPFNSVLIFEVFILGSAITFNNDEIKRAISVTHVPEDLKTLAGQKCVPMYSCKPAMSVLPISRTAETNVQESSEDSSVANATTSNRKKSFSNVLSSRLFNFDDISHSKFDSCTECKCESCVCSLLDEYENYLLSTGSNIEINNVKSYDQAEFDERLQMKKVQPLENICDFENIPEWLRYVSPYYMPTVERCEDDIFIEIEDDKTLSEESAKCEAASVYSKHHSVQELLNLAEEVEKSFTQKAKQFESFESVLQEELTSLEKDLEAVHKIHETVWSESRLSWLTSSTHDREDPKASYENKTVEKDLIDFKIDIPAVPSPKMKIEEYAPEVITHLQNRFVQCGCRTRLYCSISGKPDPQIAWLKNGKLLPQSSRYVCSNLVEFGLYLDIYNAKSSDSGEYMCIATNSHGSAQTQAYLTVAGHREYSPEEPKFLTSPHDVKARKGESVTLEWKIDGTPFPHVMWFKNARRIQTSLRVDTFSNHRGLCRLVLHDLESEDGAIYTCYLENDAGSAISTVQVTVTDGTQNQRLEESSDIESTMNKFLSKTEDNYIPSLKYYEDFLYERSKPVSADTSTKSKYRRSEWTQKVPGTPFAPKILNSGNTWAILSWSMPIDTGGNSGELVYFLERRLLDSNRWVEIGETPNTLYTVSGLKKGQSYVFRISAGNSNGWGPPVTLTQPVHCKKDGRAQTTAMTSFIEEMLY